MLAEFSVGPAVMNPGPHTIPFEYLDESHLIVTWNYNGGGPLTTTNYTLNPAGTQITFLDAQISATVFRVRRETPDTALLVGFTQGATISSADVTYALTQLLYRLQELIDAQ